MRLRLNRFAEANHTLTAARRVAHELGERETEAHLLLDEATVHEWQCDYALSASRTEQAADILSAPPPLLQARIWMAMSRVHWHQSRTDVCVAFAARAAELAQTLGDAGYETHVICLLIAGETLAFGTSSNEVTERRLEHAERLLDQAVALARGRGDTLHICAALINRAGLHMARADPNRMFSDINESLRLTREGGLGSEPLLRCSIGEFYLVLGQYEDASTAIDETVRVSEAMGASWFVQKSRQMTARVAWQQGRLVQAKEALHALAAAQNGPHAATFAPGDQAVIDAIQLGLAQADEGTWDRFVEDAAAKHINSHDFAEVLEARALCSLGRGQRELAQEQLRTAIAHCQHNGAPLMEQRLAKVWQSLADPGPGRVAERR